MVFCAVSSVVLQPTLSFPRGATRDLREDACTPFVRVPKRGPDGLDVGGMLRNVELGLFFDRLTSLMAWDFKT